MEQKNSHASPCVDMLKIWY